MQSLAIFKALGDRAGEGLSLNGLGIVSKDFGDYAHAREYYGQSLAIAKALGIRAFEWGILGNLGDNHLDQGRFREALDNYKQINDPINLGLCRLRLGEYESARKQFLKFVGRDETTRNVKPLISEYLGLGHSYEGLKNGQESNVVADPVFNLSDDRLKTVTKPTQTAEMGLAQTAIRGWLAERGG